jgi:hypothetical protein
MICCEKESFLNSDRLPARNQVKSVDPLVTVQTMMGTPIQSRLLTSRLLPFYCAFIKPLMKVLHDKILIVSYGWKNVGFPDPLKEVLNQIKKFIAQSDQNFVGIIIDYSSFYQLPRSETQVDQFEVVLKDMHLLYTFPNVTVLRIDTNIENKDPEINRLRKHVYVFNCPTQTKTEIEQYAVNSGVNYIAIQERFNGSIFVIRCYDRVGANKMISSLREQLGSAGSVVSGYCDVPLELRTWPTIENFAAQASGNSVYYTNCINEPVPQKITNFGKFIDETYLQLIHSRSCEETRTLALSKFINTLVVFGYWYSAIKYYIKIKLKF